MSEILRAPAHFRLSVSDGAVTARWDKVKGADGYKLQYFSADDPARCIKTRYSQGTKKTILGFANGRTYLACVRAFRYENEREVLGEASEKLTFTPISVKLKAQNTICLNIGETAALRWECRNEVPAAAFRSENKSVAVVDAKGVVTAVSAGTTFIEITTEDKQSFRTKIAVERSADFPPQSAVLMLAGDIMCAVNHQRAVSGTNFDFHDAFSEIGRVLSEADYAVGVLKTTCDDGAPYECEELRLPSGAPNCNSPSSFLAAIADAGFDALVTATNHSGINGRDRLSATVSAIGRYNLTNIGTEGANPVLVNIKGIRVAFIACTMVPVGADNAAGDMGLNRFGRYDRNYFLELINNAYAQGAEFIVAYQHWGAMNSAKLRKSQIAEARFMANAGAGLIVGSQPHVVQRFSYIKTQDGRRVPCAFSLGNFLTTMNEMRENRDSLILRAELSRGEKGVSAKLSYIPVMSETRPYGAAVVPVYPAFGKECAESLSRTKAALGAGVSHSGYRPRILLSGSGNLRRIFSSGKGFRADKACLGLSQLALGADKGYPCLPTDDKAVCIDVGNSLGEYIEKTTPEYIAVDFYAAAANACYRTVSNDSGATRFFTSSKRFRASSFYRENKPLLERIRPPFGEQVWKPLVKNYADTLRAHISSDRIILFRCRMNGYAEIDNQLRTVPVPKSTERMLTAMEEYFIALVHPSVIDLSANYFSDALHTGRYESAYYYDAYKAAELIAADSGIRAARVPDAEIWFDRVLRYYDSMTARSYQSRLLDMENAADVIIAFTSRDFASRQRERLIRLKKAGKSDLDFVSEYFADEPAAGELVAAAEIIREVLGGNLNHPYDFFAPAFKEHFNIVKRMVRLLAHETGVSVNENNAELVFLLRNKAQLKRYAAGLARMTVDIWGSCVSRESVNRSANAFIGRYIAKQPPVLAFEPAVPVEFPETEEPFCGSVWRRRVMRDAFSRSGTSDIIGSGSSWLVVDFYDTICSMAEYGGTLFETDEFTFRTDFYKSIANDCKECFVFEKRDMKFCFDAVTRFAEAALQRYGKNIILIKAEPKSSYISCDDRLLPMEADPLYDIKKRFILLCEERFANVTDCYVIDISGRFFSSDRYPQGGRHIVHYEDEFYRRAGSYISEILMGTERRVFTAVDENYILLRTLKLNRD